MTETKINKTYDEINAKIKTKDAPQANRNIGIASEVAIDLKRKKDDGNEVSQ